MTIRNAVAAIALFLPLCACPSKPPSEVPSPTPTPPVDTPPKPVPTPTLQPVKEVAFKCLVTTNQSRVETCTILVPERRVYQLKYTYYSERYDREKEATLSVRGAAGLASELPGLRPCGVPDKKEIDNNSLAWVECALEMEPGRQYAFRAEVVSENGKNGTPKPGLEVK